MVLDAGGEGRLVSPPALRGTCSLIGLKGGGSPFRELEGRGALKREGNLVLDARGEESNRDVIYEHGDVSTPSVGRHERIMNAILD